MGMIPKVPKFALNKKNSRFLKLDTRSKGRITLIFGSRKLNGEEVYPHSITVGTRQLAKCMASMVLLYPEIRIHFAKNFFGVKDQKVFTGIIDNLFELKNTNDQSIREITKMLMVAFAEEKIKQIKSRGGENESEAESPELLG